uniref:Pleckstrin homology domain-containing family J member 1 n=1 Tax=Scylla olivacea TaxID=85551 RepID=A0A0P4VYU7_SCYOL
MHYNNDSLVHFAETAGDHEGRLTHKSPPRTLYDSAYKERWFKLRANLLFYYRLNEFGGVEKNEPSGVFVLENVEIQMEHTDLPFGFAIRWKDDLERKHLFFASSEASAVTWMNKLINARILLNILVLLSCSGHHGQMHPASHGFMLTWRRISYRKSYQRNMHYSHLVLQTTRDQTD